MPRKQKPWGGRFREETHPLAEEFTASIHFDKRLYRYDIMGSIAHAKMLARCHLISRAEADMIVKGLKEIEAEIEGGRFPFDPALEDIHMNIEHRLTEKIGEVGEKLHTGRSRNDQIALDLRLYLRDEIGEISYGIKSLQNVLRELARRYLDQVMPGYTHLRRAQPILFSHYILAYYEMFKRDRERYRDCLSRVNVMPLGSGALAGSGLNLDREYVAKLLRFPTVTRNSIDAVADRDFIAEFLSASALTMMHLSRLAEDFIIFSSEEFGFVRLPEAFTTGSSLMPQKGNPDVLELIRGKTGKVYGSLISLLTTLKALPLSYNRDLQEDKEPLFDAVDTVKASLRTLTEMLKGIGLDERRMAQAVEVGFLTATDAVEYLVKKGLPFREAHRTVGRLVRYCQERGKRLKDLSLRELKKFSERFGADFYDAVTVTRSIEARGLKIQVKEILEGDED